MKSPNQFKKVFIHRDHVDMRKAINGLSQIAESAQMGNQWGRIYLYLAVKQDR